MLPHANSEEGVIAVDTVVKAVYRRETNTLIITYLDQTLDVLNARYGRRVVRRGIVFAEQDFCRIQPSEKSLMNPFAHAGQGNSPEHSRKATDLS